jgi:hypothetical protein
MPGAALLRTAPAGLCTRRGRAWPARGGVARETTIIDHDGRGLAGVVGELAYLDAQGGRPQGLAGTPGDGNARLYRAARRR